MIIQLRGTSGSGKTTAMRAIMAGLGVPRPLAVRVAGRRNPLWYQYGNVAVIGSYESTCGGCDTIHGYPLLIQTVRERLAERYHVLMEGLLLSEDVKQTLSLPHPLLQIIFLATPLDTCLERVKARRAARGNDKPLNPHNTSNRVDTINRARAKLEDAGVYCRLASGDQAARMVLAWLRGEVA